MTIKNGTQHNDSITDTGAWSVVYGLAGNDTINASTSGIGVQVYGGLGNDSITGSASKDFLFGGYGNDTINSGNGNDQVYGGVGNDSISGGAGNDMLSGDAGNDTVTGGAGNQTIFGGDGNDTVNLGTDTTAGNKHYLYGGNGNDSIVGNLSTNTTNLTSNWLIGGAGNDTLIGSVNGHDVMNAGVGVNVITGNATNHANELAGFGDQTAAVQVNLSTTAYTLFGGIAASTGLGAGTTDTITNVDNINGSTFADLLVGNTNGNTINGGAGNDTIDSGGTSTSLAAGVNNAGNDSLFGGQGNDTFVLHSGTSGSVTADSIDGGIGVNTLDFSNVFVTGTAAGNLTGLNALSAPTGTYTLNTITGVEVNLSQNIDNGNLYAFAGQAGVGSITNIQNVIGTSGADYMVGIGGATMSGGAGNDTLVGGVSGPGTHDVLLGGTGTNVYDGTTASTQNYYGIGNATGENDTIYGWSGLASSAASGLPDKLYVSLSQFNLAGHGAAMAVTTDYTTTVTAGVTTYTLNAADVVDFNGTVASNFTATATTHAEFLFNTATGAIYFAPTATTATTAASLTSFATIDVNSSTFNTGTGHVNPIDNTDFILVA